MRKILSNKKYVTLNETQDTVISVLEGSTGIAKYDDTDPNLVIVDSSVVVSGGYSYNNGVFTPPVPIPTVIKTVDISGPVEVLINIPTNYTVEVRNDEVVDTTFNGTFYVPIKNILTNEIVTLVKCVMTDGVGTSSITLTGMGIYKIFYEMMSPNLPSEYTYTGVKDIVVL